MDSNPEGQPEKGVDAMRCPFCHNPDSRVIDSRETDEGVTTRRRRSCPGCGRRFTTVEEAVLAVVKRSGVTETVHRAKGVAGGGGGPHGEAGGGGAKAGGLPHGGGGGAAPPGGR